MIETHLIFSDPTQLINMGALTFLLLPAVGQNPLINIWKVIGTSIWYLILYFSL